MRSNTSNDEHTKLGKMIGFQVSWLRAEAAEAKALRKWGNNEIKNLMPEKKLGRNGQILSPMAQSKSNRIKDIEVMG